MPNTKPRVFVFSDNAFLIKAFHELMHQRKASVQYACSPMNKALADDKTLPVFVKTLDIKTEWEQVAAKFDLVFSLHCKQIFPAGLVQKVKCINVHPGFNPYNRGWFPQVFSILNKLPVGATIHEIDEQLDHGPIIAQREIKADSWDTSYDIYCKVQQVEIELLKENLTAILARSYSTFAPKEEGNVNLKRDFNALCKINPDQVVTMQQAIDLLRAVTYAGYKNAYYIDKETGAKVYVSLNLQKED